MDGRNTKILGKLQLVGPTTKHNTSIGVNRPTIMQEIPHFALFPAIPHVCENVPHFSLDCEKDNILRKSRCFPAPRRHFVHRSCAKTRSAHSNNGRTHTKIRDHRERRHLALYASISVLRTRANRCPPRTGSSKWQHMLMW